MKPALSTSGRTEGAGAFRPLNTASISMAFRPGPGLYRLRKESWPKVNPSRLDKSGRKYPRRRIDVLARHHLCRAPQRGIAQFRIPAAQFDAANNLLIQQPLAPQRRGLLSAKHKLVEAWRACEQQLCPLLRRQRSGRVVGPRPGGLGQFADAFLAIDSKEDRSHQRHQSLVGTDFRGGFLAPYMLLARREGQHESAVPVAVHGLTHQPPRHLAKILLLRRDNSAEWAAVAERHAERLRFHAHNVRLDRRPHNAERNRLGNRNNQQRALRVSDSRN